MHKELKAAGKLRDQAHAAAIEKVRGRLGHEKALLLAHLRLAAWRIDGICAGLCLAWEGRNKQRNHFLILLWAIGGHVNLFTGKFFICGAYARSMLLTSKVC